MSMEVRFVVKSISKDLSIGRIVGHWVGNCAGPAAITSTARMDKVLSMSSGLCPSNDCRSAASGQFSFYTTSIFPPLVGCSGLLGSNSSDLLDSRHQVVQELVCTVQIGARRADVQTPLN